MWFVVTCIDVCELSPLTNEDLNNTTAYELKLQNSVERRGHVVPVGMMAMAEAM
jgi:hypothetical protein